MQHPVRPADRMAKGCHPRQVKAGQKVTWINTDDSPHQITVAGPKGARSPVLLKGQSTELVFNEAGTIDYICGLHPSMKGKIEVK